jgi:hypothetical protein
LFAPSKPSYKKKKQVYEIQRCSPPPPPFEVITRVSGVLVYHFFAVSKPSNSFDGNVYDEAEERKKDEVLGEPARNAARAPLLLSPSTSCSLAASLSCLSHM